MPKLMEEHSYLKNDEQLPMHSWLQEYQPEWWPLSSIHLQRGHTWFPTNLIITFICCSFCIQKEYYQIFSTSSTTTFVGRKSYTCTQRAVHESFHWWNIKYHRVHWYLTKILLVYFSLIILETFLRITLSWWSKCIVSVHYQLD